MSGVYAKVMNFRSIDPRAEGEGMSGASGTDRTVWQEFYDLQSSTLLTDTLRDEFARLWGATASEDHTGPPQANAVSVMIEDEALRLEALTLDELLARYAEQKVQNSRRPSTRLLSTRSYERNALVIAIGRVRASHRCEVPECTHPTFETAGGVPYTEVHHIMPLADGGDDTIENVACLCPVHHREVHLGTRATELTAQLRAVRTTASQA